MIQILPLGGGQDVGRSCIIVTIGGRNIMFDCGMHMGYNDERRFPDFTVISTSRAFDRVIDLVIISHFHLDHCGGLPYFTEMCGYSGPIIMTYPTKDICPILLEDFRKITVDRRGEQNFFTSSMIQACMNKVTAVDLSQEVLIGLDIKVKAYYAGHVLGAAMFHVQVGQESVLYTGDYNMTPDRHLGAAVIDRCQPDVLITESTYAATIRDSKRARERDFLKQIHHCVASNGKVLVPTFALGRVQELCILIDAYWTRAGLSDIPVYFTGGMAEMATKYYKNWIDWTNEGIQMAALAGAQKDPDLKGKSGKHLSNPFNFKNIKPFERSFADLPGPMLVFSTPGMLHSGTSLELFKKWCGDPLNMLIIPGYCVAGTVGAKVLAGQKTIEVQEVRVRGTTMTSTTVNLPVNLQVKNLSFSAHVDAKGILQLIAQCRPKNVVLVHGEGGKMQILRDRITNTFNCPVYYPANGEVLFIETLPAAAKTIEISRLLWEKRKRDIAECAIEVARCEHIDERIKLGMLSESASLQDQLNAIQLDGYLASYQSDTSPNDFELLPPVLLSAWEFDASNLPAATVLKNYVRRFFLREKLLKLTSLTGESTDYLGILHSILLNSFHPQVCVKLCMETQSIFVHSIQVDSSGTCIPLLILDGVRQITIDHVEYSMKWSMAGEKLTKIVIQLIKDKLE